MIHPPDVVALIGSTSSKWGGAVACALVRKPENAPYLITGKEEGKKVSHRGSTGDQRGHNINRRCRRTLCDRIARGTLVV